MTTYAERDSRRDRTRSPEPLEWRRPPKLRERITRAVAAPALAAGVVFAAVVLVAIVIVWVQPHAATAGYEETSLGAALEATPEPRSLGAADETLDGQQQIFVHVVGEVAQPGVVELEAGARVATAIEAAGGASDAAVLSGVNLARVVADGEQVLVPNAEQVAAGVADVAGAGVGGGAAGGGAGLVNLNAADAATLETLPKVGPALAQRIIDWRERNGGFASIEQLLDVSGIGQKTFEGLQDRVTV